MKLRGYSQKNKLTKLKWDPPRKKKDADKYWVGQKAHASFWKAETNFLANPVKSETTEEMLLLRPQKYKRSQETTMKNYTPTNWTAYKKCINS